MKTPSYFIEERGTVLKCYGEQIKEGDEIGVFYRYETLDGVCHRIPIAINVYKGKLVSNTSILIINNPLFEMLYMAMGRVEEIVDGSIVFHHKIDSSD